MADDVIQRKCASIERCLRRIEEEYIGHEEEIETHFLIQDSVMLNLIRACEQTIDVAVQWVRMKKLGIPSDACESFAVLMDAGLVSESLGRNLQKMVGFRNTAVHEYQSMDMDVVRMILRDRLQDFRDFVELVLASK